MVITVIGELCDDIFVYGDVNRLSPEAPVPVFVPSHKDTNLGMAGNVVNNLKSMDRNLEINFIYQKEKITKTRYVEDKSNHMFIRIDDNNHIAKLDLNEEQLNIIKNSDAVIISDYDKGFLTEIVIEQIARTAPFVIIDTKKKLSTQTVEQFDFIKLNLHEYMNFTNEVKETQTHKLIVTLGSNGAKYMDTIYRSPDPKETIDVSGAGDTFTAAFTLNYLKTKSVSISRS